MKMGRYEEAKRGYDQAIKIDSEFSEAVDERDAAIHKLAEKTGAPTSTASMTAE